jgi:colanic acid biosynthesis protein WcaH
MVWRSFTVRNELPILLDRALEHIPDATVGLPQEAFYFVSQLTPLVNVDLLIKNQSGQTLLTWRSDEFYGPAWHIPGGIIRFKETAAERIQKVAQLELGCEVRFSPEPIKVSELFNPKRNIRGHFISLLYLCELISDPDKQKKMTDELPLPGHWAWHSGCPENFLNVQEPFRKYIDDACSL